MARTVIYLLSLLCLIFVNNTSGDPTTTVQGLIGRLIGTNRVQDFQLELLASPASGRDVFEIEARLRDTDRVVIKGTSGVALSSGFYWYLKYYCNASVTWGVNGTGNQLALANHLALVPSALRMESPVQWRYYMNTCTHSYSAVWWDWKRWEQEIDWMALHGINLPLAFTGQEYIWNKLFSSMGLTSSEISAFLGGPAFLAWSRMGNIKGWGGPLPSGWMEEQYKLQLKILEREIEFGMTPVLPGFAGFVPDALKRIYPQVNITKSSDWGRFPTEFCCVSLLDPADEIFGEIAEKFIVMQKQYYPTRHFYNADTFNEMRPSSSDPDYLARISKGVYDGMKRGDPDAIWVMQGWLFFSESYFWNNITIKAYLDAVPNDEMLILDLYAEETPIWSRTDNFYGKPYIWCMLHNFGGRRGVYGNLSRIATGAIDARKSPGSTQVGVGLTMEAIEQNPIVYELMTEMAWRSTHFDVERWVQDYVHQRYGVANHEGAADAVTKAWELLLTSVYNNPTQSVATIQQRPRMGWSGTITEANTTRLTEGGRVLFSAFSTLQGAKNGPYQYDLVDVVRQIVSNIFYDVFRIYRDIAINAPDVIRLDHLSALLLQMIDDTDQMLGTNPNFLLGEWIQGALSQANSDEEKALYMMNARNQLGGWGPNSNIDDYAAKQWSGLVAQYYGSRWSFFFDFVRQAVAQDQNFNETMYVDMAFAMEQEWTHDERTFPVTVRGNVEEMVAKIEREYYTMPNNYKAMPGIDFPGNDIVVQATWTKDVATLAIICNHDPACVGFNSNGWIKMALGNKSPSKSIFYLKQ